MSDAELLRIFEAANATAGLLAGLRAVFDAGRTDGLNDILVLRGTSNADLPD